MQGLALSFISQQFMNCKHSKYLTGKWQRPGATAGTAIPEKEKHFCPELNLPGCVLQANHQSNALGYNMSRLKEKEGYSFQPLSFIGSVPCLPL